MTDPEIKPEDAADEAAGITKAVEWQDQPAPTTQTIEVRDENVPEYKVMGTFLLFTDSKGQPWLILTREQDLPRPYVGKDDDGNDVLVFSGDTLDSDSALTLFAEALISRKLATNEDDLIPRVQELIKVWDHYKARLLTEANAEEDAMRGVRGALKGLLSKDRVRALPKVSREHSRYDGVFEQEEHLMEIAEARAAKALGTGRLYASNDQSRDVQCRKAVVHRAMLRALLHQLDGEQVGQAVERKQRADVEGPVHQLTGELRHVLAKEAQVEARVEARELDLGLLELVERHEVLRVREHQAQQLAIDDGVGDGLGHGSTSADEPARHMRGRLVVAHAQGQGAFTLARVLRQRKHPVVGEQDLHVLAHQECRRLQDRLLLGVKPRRLQVHEQEQVRSVARAS